MFALQINADPGYAWTPLMTDVITYNINWKHGDDAFYEGWGHMDMIRPRGLGMMFVCQMGHQWGSLDLNEKSNKSLYG